jgi:hypothetical protein
VPLQIVVGVESREGTAISSASVRAELELELGACQQSSKHECDAGNDECGVVIAVYIIPPDQVR